MASRQAGMFFTALVLADGLAFGAVAPVPLMRVIPGARAGGMAEAGGMLWGDPAALFINPAALAWTPTSVQADGRRFLNEVSLFSLAGVARVSSDFTVGLGVLALDAGRIRVVSDAGEVSDLRAEQDVLGIFGLGRKIGEEGAFGVSSKVLSTELAEERSVQTAALDVGMAVGSPQTATFALAVQNLGRRVTFGSEPDSLPLTLRVGTAGRRSMGYISTLVGLDGVWVRGVGWQGRLGGEAGLGPLRLRAGYRIGRVLEKFVSGLGVKIADRYWMDFAAGLAGGDATTLNATVGMAWGPAVNGTGRRK